MRRYIFKARTLEGVVRECVIWADTKKHAIESALMVEEFEKVFTSSFKWDE